MELGQSALPPCRFTARRLAKGCVSWRVPPAAEALPSPDRHGTEQRMIEDHAALALAAEANFVLHAGWAPRRLPGMRVRDADGLVLIDSGLACDTFNIVCAARLALPSAPARIAATVAHFQDVGRPFTWWVGPADQPAALPEFLTAAGLALAGGETAMAVDLAALPASSPPVGLRVVRASQPHHLADFAHVVAANWRPPDLAVYRFFQVAGDLLLAADSPSRFYIGYLNDQPVAASELTDGGGVVGLYTICTLAAYRRRGFATALTLGPLLTARAEGQHTAVLQASAAGAAVYARLGFRPFGQIVEFKPASATA
jgi:GNAT superfamily N-acetyltransferase